MTSIGGASERGGSGGGIFQPARDSADPDSLIYVLLVGGTPETATRIHSLLDTSSTLRFALRCTTLLSEALEYLTSDRTDVILLDVGDAERSVSPRLAQARLRAPEVPIVAIGDIDDEAAAHRMLGGGARAYLVKSELNPRLLSTTLATALETNRVIQQLYATRERARKLATHDRLTGLANRMLFNDRLAQAVASARRSQRKIAVLFLDLDGFKMINDSLGHAVGDGLLRGVAERLKACLRQSDTAARLGGDEFAVLLSSLATELDASRVAATILDTLRRPVVIRNRSIALTASIGIATFPKDSSAPEDLITKSDTAMYHAKQRGRNRFEYYSREVNEIQVKRADVEVGLRAALDRGELTVHYQPQVDARRGRIIGAEALVRWRHPNHGLVEPAQFLGVAEDTGLVVPLGSFVLREACRQNALWQKGHRGFRVAVNVASRQLQEEGFAALVADALEENSLPASVLEIEITERSLVQDIDYTVSTLSALKRLGVHISIDDFGTGYSSLSYLKRLPVDSLKIDQSFVRGLLTDPADATIAAAIVGMAQGLNLTTVAEGVETLEQLHILGSYGCNRMQGFLFGRAAAPEMVSRWIDEPAFRWMRSSSIADSVSARE